MNTTRITMSLGKLVELTDSQTRNAMTQFRTTDMTVLSILTLVMSLETTRGTPMSSMTVMTTLVISTISPRVSHMMNGIHTREIT